MIVNRKFLLANMRSIRHLFALRGYDVTPFTDTAIATAMLAICPKRAPGWPSDEQLRAVFDRLAAA